MRKVFEKRALTCGLEHDVNVKHRHKTPKKTSKLTHLNINWTLLGLRVDVQLDEHILEDLVFDGIDNIESEHDEVGEYVFDVGHDVLRLGFGKVDRLCDTTRDKEKRVS